MKYYSAGQHRSLVIQNKTSNVVENIALAGTDAQVHFCRFTEHRKPSGELQLPEGCSVSELAHFIVM